MWIIAPISALVFLAVAVLLCLRKLRIPAMAMLGFCVFAAYTVGVLATSGASDGRQFIPVYPLLFLALGLSAHGLTPVLIRHKSTQAE